MQRERIDYDVLIVGAGPAGLAAAIRLKQLALASGSEVSVCVLEKAASIGGHSISGAVLDAQPLNALLPDWRTQASFTRTPVAHEQFVVLGQQQHTCLPAWLLPRLMRHHGQFIVSQGELVAWLGEQAEALGVELYPGFAAAAPLLEGERLLGVISGDLGRNSDGTPGAQFAAGMEIRARYTLLAEGTRGSLTGQLEASLGLRAGRVQKYGLGLKEVWRVAPGQHRRGLIQHTLGWPLDRHASGGGFIYHYGEDLVALGLVMHLDYADPYLSPFGEFQRFKQHPLLQALLAGGERVSYGARSISEGGWQSLPRLAFPGGLLLGCAAGMVNVPRIQGIHNAMHSGMLAAQAVHTALGQNLAHTQLDDYVAAWQASANAAELYAVRNCKPLVSRLGNWAGSAAAGAELWLAQAGIRLPWTLKHRQADHACTRPASEFFSRDYPAPDRQVSFDIDSSLQLAGLDHRHDQPVHLQLRDAQLPLTHNLPRYAGLEARYCPAGVYRFDSQDSKPRLQISAQNCLHCKACDIKDPQQNIVWTTPEGGSGPNYHAM